MSRLSALPADREQWLHDQVYLTIVNDGDWYREATASMPVFDRVRHVNNRWRDDLCPKEDKQMSPEERRIVNMWLYEDLLGARPHSLIYRRARVIETFSFDTSLRSNPPVTPLLPTRKSP